MTSEVDTPTADAPERRQDLSQVGLGGVLLVLALVIFVNAGTMSSDFAEIDPIGPGAFPRIVATGLLVTGLLLIVAALRGSVPEAEGGEDVDLSLGTDWRTVGALVGAFVFLIATVNVLGWTISSALFFTGCARVLGSRTLVRDLIIGAVLGLLTFYGFYSGLGVPLPAGILDGIL